jgi:hypothetical protein
LREIERRIMAKLGTFQSNWVKVVAVKLSGQGRRVLIEVSLDRTLNSTVYLVGDLEYAEREQTIVLRNLDYTVSSQYGLPAIVDGVGHKAIREFIELAARIPVASYYTGVWKNLTQALNKRLKQGHLMQGAVAEFRVKELGIHGDKGSEEVVVLGSIETTPITIRLTLSTAPTDFEMLRAPITFYTELDDKDEEDGVTVEIFRDDQRVAVFGPVGGRAPGEDKGVKWEKWSPPALFDCKRSDCPSFARPVRLAECPRMRVRISKGPSDKGWKMWFSVRGEGADERSAMLLYHLQQVQLGNGQPNSYEARFAC